jgi:uncharacterized protein (DUF885 family)
MTERTLVAMALAVSVVAGGCQAVEESSPAGPAELDALIDQYVSMKRNDYRWRGADKPSPPDLSMEGFAQRIDQQRSLLAAVRGIDPTGLTPEERIDRLLLISQLDSATYEAEARKPWENDPTTYVPFQSLSSILGQDSLAVEERAKRLSVWLAALPGMVAEGQKNLKNPAERFTRAAMFQVEGTIRFLEQEISEFAVAAEDEGLQQAAANAVTSLREYETFLKDDLLARSTGSWELGEEAYNYLLKHRWFLEDDAQSIRERGLKAFEEIEAELQEVAERIDPGKHWVEVYESLKDDHPSADGIKDAYRRQLDAAQKFLIENEVVTLPEGETVVIEDTPEAMRRSSPFGTFSSVGPFEDHLQGRLILTPIDETMSPEQQQQRLRSHHLSWIPLIAVHEAYPGHHVAGLKANENPRVLRGVVRESIFGEGWGLYTEQLMWDLGFLQGDDVRLTVLRNRLWRAARVIIDSSMHTGQMSFEEGVDLLADKVRFERFAAGLEVGMYVRMPTYVLGYLIGMMEIEKIRDDYYEQFGEPEKPKELYDKLLHSGQIPPALIRLELLGGEPTAWESATE